MSLRQSQAFRPYPSLPAPPRRSGQVLAQGPCDFTASTSIPTPLSERQGERHGAEDQTSHCTSADRQLTTEAIRRGNRCGYHGTRHRLAEALPPDPVTNCSALAGRRHPGRSFVDLYGDDDAQPHAERGPSAPTRRRSCRGTGRQRRPLAGAQGPGLLGRWAAVASYAAGEVPGGIPGQTPLDRERLGAAVDLAAPIAADRLDRRAGERLVLGEQPAQRGGFVESAVEEQGQRPVQALDDLRAIEERGRDRGLCRRDGRQRGVSCRGAVASRGRRGC